MHSSPPPASLWHLNVSARSGISSGRVDRCPLPLKIAGHNVPFPLVLCPPFPAAKLQPPTDFSQLMRNTPTCCFAPCSPLPFTPPLEAALAFLFFLPRLIKDHALPFQSLPFFFSCVAFPSASVVQAHSLLDFLYRSVDQCPEKGFIFSLSSRIIRPLGS